MEERYTNIKLKGTAAKVPYIAKVLSEKERRYTLNPHNPSTQTKEVKEAPNIAGLIGTSV